MTIHRLFFKLLAAVLAVMVAVTGSVSLSAAASPERISKPISTSIGLSAAEANWLYNHPVIHVGIMNAWPPMDYVDGRGRPQGIGVEFIRVLNKRLGNRLKIVPGPWKEIYEAVKAKRLDALMDITPRPDREAFFHFTTPYIQVPHIIFTRKNEPHKASLDELAGMTVGVEKGYFIVKVLHDKYPQVRVREYTTTSDALDAVSRSEVDAYVGNRAVAMHIIENELISNLKAQSKITETASINAIGVRKDWPILRDILQKALDYISPREHTRIITSYQRVNDIHTITDRFAQTLNAQEKDWLARHPRIRIGAMDAWPPINFVDGKGVSRGIGADYIAALNQRLGGRLVIEPAPFKASFDKVKNRQLDALMDITPKKEREAFFEFTRAYLSIPHVYVGRRDGPYFDSAKDLFGSTIALEKGYYNTRLFHKNYPRVTVREYPSTAEALGAVSRGEAAAYAGNRAVVMYLIEKELLYNLVVQGRMEKPSVRLNIGVRKDWPILARILDKALADISREEVQWIHKTWVSELRTVELGLTDEEQEWLAAKPVLRLGYDVDWPPVEFADQEGIYKGMSADYMALIAETLHMTIEQASPQSWQATIDAAKKGELDLLAAVARTPQRDAYLRFTRPYLSFPIVIVTDRRVAYISDMQELAGKTVTVVSDYASHDMLVNNHPEIVLQPAKDIIKGLQAVQNGEAYAFVGSLASISHIMGREGIFDLKVTGETPYSYDLAIGVRKDQPVLARLLQKALDAITEEKRIEIYNRWIAVTYERGFDYTIIWKILTPVAIVIILLFVWNWQLNRTVSSRTAELKTSEEKFRELVENAPLGIVVSTFDGEVLEANPAMVKMLGFSSREEALSVPAVDNYYDSLDREGFISALKKGVVRGYETRFRHREGSLLWVSQTALVQFIREGEKRILVVLEDISERKTNELELERHRKHLEELVDERTTELRQAKEAAEEAHRSLIHSQERLELALKGGDLGFWDVNLITGEMVVNRRWGEMLGYAPDALDNLTRDTWIGSLHPDDKDRVLQAGEAYRKGQIETYEVEYQVTTMSGEIRWQFSKGEYVERDEEHGALRMVGTVMDITDRKEAEEKLKQYMEELERFNRLAVGREKQIISLKQAINALLGQLGQEPKYKSVE